MDARLIGAGDVGGYAGSVSPLAERSLRCVRVEIESARDGAQIVHGEPRSSNEQQPVGLPEFPAGGRELREFGCQVSARVQFWIGQVAPDEPQPWIAIQKRGERTACHEAERAAEVPVLDQRELRLRGAEDVV